MDWYWVLLLWVGAVNAYALVAFLMHGWMFDGFGDTASSMMSLFWPVSLPLAVLGAMLYVAVLGRRRSGGGR